MTTNDKFEQDVQSCLQAIQNAIPNNRWFMRWEPIIQATDSILTNNLNKQRVSQIVFNTQFNFQLIKRTILDTIMTADARWGDSFGACNTWRLDDHLNTLFKNGAHPCFICPTQYKNLEPGNLSLLYIGIMIREARKNYQHNTNCSKKEHDNKVNEIVSNLIKYINEYPTNYIEIIQNIKPLKLKKISLINQRPSLITVPYSMDNKNKCKFNTVWIMGDTHTLFDCGLWETNVFDSIPSPKCLFKLFSAGIDIIHFYDNMKIFVSDNKLKTKLMSLFYQKCFSLIVPLFVVSNTFQSPFIASYNYLNEYTNLDDEMIRIIIEFLFNESKFEDTSYMQFNKKFVDDEITEKKENIDTDIENDQEQNLMDIICEFCILRFPLMGSEWRYWMLNEVIFKFSKEQNVMMYKHISKNPNKWNKLIQNLDLIDSDIWFFFADTISVFIEIDTKKVFDLIRLYTSSIRHDENEGDKCLELLLVKKNINFNAFDVLINTKIMGDYSQGLLWYFMCNLDINNK
eukprot:436978_1